jgi:hypothetical protein
LPVGEKGSDKDLELWLEISKDKESEQDSSSGSNLYTEAENSSKGHKGRIAGYRLSIWLMENSEGPFQEFRLLKQSSREKVIQLANMNQKENLKGRKTQKGNGIARSHALLKA